MNRVYLVLSPLGLPCADSLERALRALSLEVLAKTKISAEQWPRFDTAVHLRRSDARALGRAALYEAAWADLFPGRGGELWELPATAGELLAREKHRLRNPLPSAVLPFGELHAFHVGDPEDAAEDARRIASARWAFDKLRPNGVRSG